ncbi:MAG: hypothetical protein PX483_13800 [Nostocales cyanobacterium LE14-WE4]|nr:hypothetical protein [Nostocales cyanobacterium LE14-WE4]
MSVFEYSDRTPKLPLTAIALPHPQNSDSYGALVPSGTLPRTLSHPHISLNGDRTHIPKAITLSLHPQKAIANITKSSANSKQKPLKHLPPKP